MRNRKSPQYRPPNIAEESWQYVDQGMSFLAYTDAEKRIIYKITHDSYDEAGANQFAEILSGEYSLLCEYLGQSAVTHTEIGVLQVEQDEWRVSLCQPYIRGKSINDAFIIHDDVSREILGSFFAASLEMWEQTGRLPDVWGAPGSRLDLATSNNIVVVGGDNDVVSLQLIDTVFSRTQRARLSKRPVNHVQRILIMKYLNSILPND